jgi:queuine tRNA-ribosyltransferase
VLRVDEEGVLFRSYRDGARVLLTPETSVAAQKALGADIILPLDELPPYHINPAVLAASVARSHRWMARSLAAHLADPRKQAMYGIVHGGTDAELRAASAEYLCALPFDGFAVGGALGRDRAEMLGMLSGLMPRLRGGVPVHLLGIGDEESLVACVPLGFDTFDSAYPTRAGRHGTLLTSAGRITLRKAENAAAFRPLDEACGCATCRQHTLAYLHHLWRAREPVLASLAALHNIAHTCAVMSKLRTAILEDRI